MKILATDNINVMLFNFQRSRLLGDRHHYLLSPFIIGVSDAATGGTRKAFTETSSSPAALRLVTAMLLVAPRLP